MSGMPSPSPARNNGGDRDKDSLWYFSSEDLANSPSRKAGISPDQELSYRQMTAYLIQEMGQRLSVSQLCINTAIVYMHRFYAFHSFTHFHRNGIAAASLFLAAKVEEQPRKLEHVIKAANKCLQQTTSTTDNVYLEQAQDLVFNENVLLQTLGFDVAIDHPHTHVVKTCQLVKACKDLAQTSYFLASNSLHLTSMCLQYKPSVVACFCIYLACKWSRWEIPQSTEGKHWFHYVDETVTMDLLKKLTDEFIAIYEKSPARLKSKLNSIKALAQGASNRQGQVKDKKADQDWKVSDMMNMKMYHPAETNNQPQSSSSSQYSSQVSAGSEPMPQQQGGSLTQPMLPPPPHQSQQMRKPDLHSSSQHRSHHSSSSSSSSSHHPPKIGYSPGDVPDHKLSSGHNKQQPQPYGGSNLVSNRPPREHSSSSTMMAPTSSKSSSSSSSSRSSMSNSLPGPPIRQSTSQGHPMDVNYHKSRERGMAVPPPTSSSHNIPPHGMPHKLAQKQDGSRSLSSKDHSGRLPLDQANKQNNSNTSGNKMFPSSVSSQYGSNNLQMPPGNNSNSSQLSSKLDPMHDITRNMMHTSRGGYNNQQPTTQPPPNVPAAPLLNFHQQQQGSRHSGNTNSNNNSSSNIKHEQSKQQISVHMQQQQSQTAAHHHKQPQILSTEQSYGGLGGSHDLPQQPHAASSLISNNYSKIEPLQHSEEPSHPVNQFNQQGQSHAGKSINSLFGSPEWNKKVQGQQQEPQLSQQMPSSALPSGSGINNFTNNSGNISQNSEAYAVNTGYKMPSNAISNKESSPPKIKSERDTPSKKDKNRLNTSNQDNGRSSSSSHGSAQQQQQQMLKTTIPKKLDPSLSSSLTGLNELAGTSNVGTVGGIKRPNETVTIKQEDDLLIRDSKIRKIDTSASNDMNKHQVVNGIETNPDLVRNLLKESLCSTGGLLKTEPSIVTPSLQPPAELFEPSATTSSTNQHNTSVTSISNNVLSGNSDVSAMEIEDHGTSGSKSEKKKKKDKHKHKEKDKSKDREERKKHKKDKDRHKDKERDRDNNDNGSSNTAGAAEHVKIKISKEKIEAAGEPIGFKIKIPKERIMGDLNTSSSSQTHSEAPPVLKIKISKDKLESYSSGSTDIGSGLAGTSQPSYSHSQSSAYNSYGAGSHSSLSTTTHSSSSKKKDRDREKDRERDKEKKRSHDSSSSKSNGSGGSNSLMATGVLGSNATNGSIAGQNLSNNSGNSTTQKPQYSSKMHHQSSMSLLFGESNESNDDDDDYNDDY